MLLAIVAIVPVFAMLATASVAVLLSLSAARRLPLVAKSALLAGTLSISILLVLPLSGTNPPLWLGALAAVATLVSATFGGSAIAGTVLRFAIPPSRVTTAETVESTTADSPVEDAADAAALPASTWIGFVERFGFTLALIIGLTEVAAILIGVKALGQYAENRRNEVAATRVLGTLASVSWALACFVFFWLFTR